MEEKKKPGRPLKVVSPPLSKLEEWAEAGVPCSYVRFQQPIPPYENAEPVSEFKLGSPSTLSNKYKVDSIHYTEHGVIWRYKGELDISALANVMYARSCLK